MLSQVPLAAPRADCATKKPAWEQVGSTGEKVRGKEAFFICSWWEKLQGGNKPQTYSSINFCQNLFRGRSNSGGSKSKTATHHVLSAFSAVPHEHACALTGHGHSWNLAANYEYVL